MYLILAPLQQKGTHNKNLQDRIVKMTRGENICKAHAGHNKHSVNSAIAALKSSFKDAIIQDYITWETTKLTLIRILQIQPFKNRTKYIYQIIIFESMGFFPLIFISSCHNDDHNTIILHSKDSKKIKILKQNVLGFLLTEWLLTCQGHFYSFHILQEPHDLWLENLNS